MSIPLISTTKRKVEEVENLGICILCAEACEEKHPRYSDDMWSELKALAFSWNGLDKFGNVFDDVDWDSGPRDKLWHKNCRAYMGTLQKRQQAQKRMEKKQSEAKEDIEVQPSSSTPDESPKFTRSKTGKLQDKYLCVWCMLPYDTKHPDRDSFHVIQQQDSWISFKAHVNYIEDIEMKSRILKVIDATPDPFATEIRYHLTCWKKYVKPVYSTSNLSNEQIEFQNCQLLEVKNMFIKHVKEAVFENCEPRTLTGLLMDYVKMLSNFGLDTINMKTQTIKTILITEFGMKIGFHDRFQKNRSTIVYDTEAGGNYIEAAVNCWGLDNDDLFNIVARRLRENLENRIPLTWPPHVDDLVNSGDIPSILLKFVTWLRNPIITDFSEYQEDPIINSISSILESYITRARTSFQTKLSITMHGLTRSREIIDLLNKFGLGIQYNDVLQLHDAWAKQELEANIICPEELKEGFPSTVIVDNDDFKDDDLTGGTTSHRTNMMYVQPEHVIIPKSERSSLSFASKPELLELCTSQHTITPYKTVKRGEPSVFPKLDMESLDTNQQRKRLLVHATIRITKDDRMKAPEHQLIGTFGGFCASIKPSVMKSKPFYFLTFPKPPHKSVLNTVMEKAAAAADLKSMPFIQVVGDQPVYTLMSQLKYENPGKFSSVVPVLGAFHTQLSFIAAINKRTKDCGIADLVVDAGVIAEGSVEQALKGKHYNRAIRIFKLLYEVLARCLISKGHEEGIVCPQNEKLKILRDPHNHSKEYRDDAFEDLVSDKDFSSYVKDLFEIVERSESHMATFWTSIMKMIEILMMNIHCLRTKDSCGFKDSLRLMLPWLTIYDNDKYSRWLTEFWLQISSLPEEHDQLMSELFSQSMTGKPYSNIAMDLWIECTMNKGSKMKSGWKRLLKNEKSLLAHVKNANSVNSVRHSLHAMANISDTVSTFHKENTKFRLSADEQAIRDMENLLDQYDSNPFNFNKPQLRSLQSGLLASDTLVKDLESALSDGEVALSSFVQDRMFSQVKSFSDPIRRKSRCSFGKPPKSNVANTRVMQTDAMENRAMCEAVSLAEKNPHFSLTSLFEYRVTDECLPIFNINGTLRKCQKSKLAQEMHFITLEVDKNYIALIDMGFLWRKSSPTAEDREKGDESEYTWRDWSQRIFNMVRQRHNRAGTIVCVNDSYEDTIVSIKDSEHEKRSSTFVSGSKNIYPQKNEKFPAARELNQMFTNKANKRRIQSFLKEEFTHFSQVFQPQVKIVYSVRDICEEISTIPHQRIHEYECLHTEADTILLYIYSKMRESGITDDIVIDAEDTDVVVLCAYAAHKISGSLGLKRQGSIYDCKMLCSEEMAEIIIPLHTNTGADAISSFFGQGKKAIFAKVNKFREYRSLLSPVGQTLPANYSVVDGLRTFTIRCIYNDKTSNSLSEARARKWSSMKRKSTLRIPPDEESHKLRSQRVAYQSYIWLHFNLPDAPPSPLNHGWQMVGGNCVPVRHRSRAIPFELKPITPVQVAMAESDSDNSGSDIESESPSDLSESDSDE